jgi:hypothetical protein
MILVKGGGRLLQKGKLDSDIFRFLLKRTTHFIYDLNLRGLKPTEAEFMIRLEWN